MCTEKDYENTLNSMDPFDGQDSYVSRFCATTGP